MEYPKTIRIAAMKEASICHWKIEKIPRVIRTSCIKATIPPIAYINLNRSEMYARIRIVATDRALKALLRSSAPIAGPTRSSLRFSCLNSPAFSLIDVRRLSLCSASSACVLIKAWVPSSESWTWPVRFNSSRDSEIWAWLTCWSNLISSIVPPVKSIPRFKPWTASEIILISINIEDKANQI